jgi:hypothetical protein
MECFREGVAAHPKRRQAIVTADVESACEFS